MIEDAVLDQIKSEYVSGATYKQLGEKYGVSWQEIGNHAREENWKALRKKINKATQKKIERAVVNAVSSERAAQVVVLDKAASEFAELLQEVVHKIKMAERPQNCRDIESLAKALEATQRVLMNAYGLMTPTDQARIRIEEEKLKIMKDQAELAAQKDQIKLEPVQVEFKLDTGEDGDPFV